MMVRVDSTGKRYITHNCPDWQTFSARLSKRVFDSVYSLVVRAFIHVKFSVWLWTRTEARALTFTWRSELRCRFQIQSFPNRLAAPPNHWGCPACHLQGRWLLPMRQGTIRNSRHFARHVGT